MSTIREQCSINIAPSRPAGGQQVGTDIGIITVTHNETGIQVVLPPISRRSQHTRVLAAVDAIEFLLASV